MRRTSSSFEAVMHCAEHRVRGERGGGAGFEDMVVLTSDLASMISGHAPAARRSAKAATASRVVQLGRRRGVR